MTTTESITEALAPLGRATLDDLAFAELVRTITGRPDAKPASVRIEPVDYEIGTPSTEGLLRLRGTAELAGGYIIDWSCFVKRLQSAKWWDKLHLVPEEDREFFIANLAWRIEIAAHTSGVASLL